MNADHIKKKVYQYRIMKRLAAFMTNRKEVVFAYAHGSFTEDIRKFKAVRGRPFFFYS